MSAPIKIGASTLHWSARGHRATLGWMRLLAAALVLLTHCARERARPDSSAAHRDLGVQWLARARAEAEAGRDPGALALRGLSELEEARILDSADPLVVEEMARAHAFMADHLWRRGGDPRP